MDMSLHEALGVDRGIVCAVGAGGKKSLLHALAAGHDSGAGRLAMTATARCTPPPAGLFDACIAGCGEALLERLQAVEGSRLFYAGEQERPGRHDGVDAATIARLHEHLGLALSLVKADGARMRWVKAPSEDEPLLVPGTALVIPVLSMRALGRPLDEKSAHRPERITALTGLAAGGTITEDTLARLLVHPEGSLRGCGGVRVVPVLNMVDDEAVLAAGRRIAEAALARSDRFDRVVLTRLREADRPRLWSCSR